MKAIVMAAVAAATLISAGVATAATEADADKAGCMKCHKMDAKGKGPSFKESAAKFKGKSADDVYAAMMDIKSHKKLELPEAQVKDLAAWVLTVK